MARLTNDILRGYKFTVSLEGNYFDRTAFQKVSGLKSSVEVVEYREGNMADRMEKFAGMMTYDAVTFERGISNDDDFNKWMKTVCDVTSGGEMPSGGLGDTGNASYRKDITVKLYNKQGALAKEYKLLDAFPSEYTIGDFDATSNDVVISSMTIQHHGIIETDRLS